MDLETFEEIGRKLSLSAMGKPALIGIVAILVVVAVAAGRLLWGAATVDEFSLSKADIAEDAQAQQGGEGGGPAAPPTIFVHVSGEVGNPGLYEVEAGSRVAAAVQAAGGFTDEAHADSVNLARTLEDGEQIVVARKTGDGEAVGADSGWGAAAGGASSGSPGASPALVNINLASEPELMSLPGVGEATAAKIVADRQANGSFKTVDDLKRVSGIGDKKFEALSGLICV